MKALIEQLLSIPLITESEDTAFGNVGMWVVVKKDMEDLDGKPMAKRSIWRIGSVKGKEVVVNLVPKHTSLDYNKGETRRVKLLKKSFNQGYQPVTSFRRDEGMDWGPAGSPSSQGGPPKYYPHYSFRPGLKGEFDIKVLLQMEKIFRKHSYQEAFRAGQYDRQAVEKDLAANDIVLKAKHWRKIGSIIQKNVKWWRKNLESERAGYGRY